jgi:hypothetical protein
MTPRLRNILLLLAASATLRADFPAAGWRLRRPVAGAASGIATVRLDRAVYAGSANALADLRLVRDGRDIPYVLETQPESESLFRREARILDKAIHDGDLELTLDFGAANVHNRLRLDSPRQNFRQRVRIETSDDSKRWAVVRSDAAILDFTQDNHQLRSMEIDYPDSTRRYVRVTILGWTDPGAVRGASVEQYERRDAARESYTPPNRCTTENKDKTTILTCDLGSSGTPVDRIQLDVPDKGFDRGVQIESSGDGQIWIPNGFGSISRYAGGEHLNLACAESTGRYWRVRVFNADDQPLPVSVTRFLGLARTLRFEAASGVYLYYGNANAPAPSYDLARRLARDNPPPATALTLGPEEANPAWTAPVKPWTERSPALLYTVLAVSIAILGFVGWRLLQSMSAGNA